MFTVSLEQQFGSGHSIPVLNDTRWNSTYRQYSAILSVDRGKLRSLLTDVQTTHLLMSHREYDQLAEVVNILAPFVDATDLTQGDRSVTISRVLPAVLVLNRALSQRLLELKFAMPLVKALQASLHEQFLALFRQVNVNTDFYRTSSDQ